MADGYSPEDPLLTLASAPPIVFVSTDALDKALDWLWRLASGQAAMLARGQKHYIKAIRHNDFWAAETRSGAYLTLASFTAGMTTDYCERNVQEDRATNPLWKRITRSIRALSPERSLSTTQVRTLFTEFFRGKKFTIPQAGA